MNEEAARVSPTLRHIAWLIDAPVETVRDGALTSKLASARYRCLSPVQELATRGIHCSIVHNVLRSDPAELARDLRQRGVDVIVAGKPLGPNMIELARLVRSQGIRLIADFCDDFFDDPQSRSAGLALALLADRIIASTPLLAQELERHLGFPATIVTDPYEGPRGAPRFAPGRDRLELLWFGAARAYPTIAPVMPQLLALSSQYRLRLTVVTAVDHIVRMHAPLSPNFLLDHAAWTLAGLWQHLEACDLVIIPSLRSPYHAAKSPNRLVEAIWAGRAVAAHGVPSYGDFSEFCCLGEDIAGAIATMVGDPVAVERRIAAGQTFIARRHAPAVVAAQWHDCLLDAGTAASGTAGILS